MSYYYTKQCQHIYDPTKNENYSSEQCNLECVNNTLLPQFYCKQIFPVKRIGIFHTDFVDCFHPGYTPELLSSLALTKSHQLHFYDDIIHNIATENMCLYCMRKYLWVLINYPECCPMDDGCCEPRNEAVQLLFIRIANNINRTAGHRVYSLCLLLAQKYQPTLQTLRIMRVLLATLDKDQIANLLVNGLQQNKHSIEFFNAAVLLDANEIIQANLNSITECR